jgi:hypothetical protein
MHTIVVGDKVIGTCSVEHLGDETIDLTVGR